MTHEAAIVGAGAAGAGAAYALRKTDVEVTVLEKSRGVCGRAATRRKDGCVYDHGANYVKSDNERVTRLVEGALDSEGLVDITEPVWTFDADGEISEGEDRDEHKWTYEDGITQLAKRLFDRTDADVRTETRIEAIERNGEGHRSVDNNDDGDDAGTGSGWRPVDTDGEGTGRYDVVLLTPPAPQTAELVGETALDEDLRADLVSEIEAVGYRTQLTAVLHYPFAIDRPYYALVNTDHEHDIAWLSREECKSGHVPDGECLLIAQMAPNWSTERYDEPGEQITDAAADLVGKLFDDERFADPDWTDVQPWRFAIPDNGADADVLSRAEGEGMFFAGDWVVGEGRVHEALGNGLDAGERIAERLG